MRPVLVCGGYAKGSRIPDAPAAQSRPNPCPSPHRAAIRCRNWRLPCRVVRSARTCKLARLASYCLARSGEKNMPTSVISSGAQRDLRIDFFRGLALLFIFVDHVPDNVLAKFTLRNFGFSDAAEVFVLLAGFSAVLAYSRVFEGQGFKAGLNRVFDRVRDIYIWHLALIVICSIGLTYAASYFGNFSYAQNIGVHVFSLDPARSTVMAALL